MKLADGYAAVQRSYDEQGRLLEDIVLDAHGNYASITYRNAAGESVSLSDGTFRKVYVYDKDGKKRRHTEFYDKEGKLLRREFE